MKKFILATMMTSVVMLTGCGTHHVSKDIATDGSGAQTIIFPKPEQAWIKQGTFPNVENLTKIDKGMTKDDLYYLLGIPHFSEAQHASEWDYLFKFRDAKTREVAICQYKILFDDKEQAQSFYWSPQNCVDNLLTNEPKIIVKEAPVKVVPSIKNERITLEADALFTFNKHRLGQMLSAGRYELDALAKKLVNLQKNHDTRIMVTGHTDRLGDDMYNLNLSQLRAQTVRSYLISRGVEASTVSASGAGETSPVKQCSMSMSRLHQINCLQPNRRVTIDVAYY